MNEKRIDNLRNLVAKIGVKQAEYYKFFSSFAYRLEGELGDYLGDRKCVALCCAFDDFTFDKGSYHLQGLGFEDGKYRIPLMVKLKNLNDDGDFLVRFRVYFTKDNKKLSAQINGESTQEFSETDCAPLHEYIYRHLCNSFADFKWFEQFNSDYQHTKIGFASGV